MLKGGDIVSSAPREVRPAWLRSHWRMVMPRMPEVIGIDHVYITVSDLGVSERFYDRVMVEALGFRKNKFVLGGDPHVQYFNRQFGFVLRPARVPSRHEPYSPGLHHFCFTTFLAIVGDLEAYAVGVLEEGGCVVGRVLRIQPCFCGADAEMAQPLFDRLDIGG